MKKESRQKETLGRILKYMKKYWLFLGLSIALAVISVILTLYIPILTGDAIDYIVDKGKVDFTYITPILKKMVVVILITAVAQWIMNVCNNKMTYNIVRDIRKDAIRKIEILPLKYLDAHSYGEIVSRVIADVDQFADGLLMGFTQLFTGVVTIVGTLGFMLSVNVKITAVVVFLTPLSFVVAGFIAKKTFSMFKLQSETRGEQTALIDEMIGNQKIVQAFSHEDEALESFDEINERLEKYSLRALFFSSITNPCTRFINALVYAGVGVFGAVSAIHGGISVGQLSCFLSYANQYTKPFNEISGVVTELQNALACAARVFELIDEAHLDNKDVWKRANLDRKHFSKIQCDQNYHPKKKTVMALCIALQLDLEQSRDLLARADWAFSPSSKADLIVQKAIIDKQYDIMQLNVTLFKYTNEILGV